MNIGWMFVPKVWTADLGSGGGGSFTTIYIYNSNSNNHWLQPKYADEHLQKHQTLKQMCWSRRRPQLATPKS